MWRTTQATLSDTAEMAAEKFPVNKQLAKKPCCTPALNTNSVFFLKSYSWKMRAHWKAPSKQLMGYLGNHKTQPEALAWNHKWWTRISSSFLKCLLHQLQILLLWWSLLVMWRLFKESFSMSEPPKCPHQPAATTAAFWTQPCTEAQVPQWNTRTLRYQPGKSCTAPWANKQNSTTPESCKGHTWL